MGKKILFYFASNSVWYKELYKSVKKGFEEAGCEVIGQDTLLEPEELIKQIDRHKPDFVFEHNRVKSEIPNFPKGVIHICWLVDFWGRTYENLLGSDILYVWAEDWVGHFKKIGVHHVYHLPAATDKEIYKPLGIDKKHRFVFAGHISKKWTIQELNRKVGTQYDKEIMFKDLLPYIEKYVLAKKPQKPLFDFLQKKEIFLDSPIDSTLLYDIEGRIFRQTRREFTLDYILKKYNNLIIYGPENWKLYDKYKRLYQGFIESPIELNKNIQKAHIMIHDGNYPHFRVFDAMASGVVVTAIKPHSNYNDPWGTFDFYDKKDFISLDIFNDSTDMSIFENDKLLDNIRKNAQEKVLKKHLWLHRAEQVLKDVKNILNIKITDYPLKGDFK